MEQGALGLLGLVALWAALAAGIWCWGRALRRADGPPAVAPGPRAARLMQEVVWDVVTSYPKTGVPQGGAEPKGAAVDG